MTQIEKQLYKTKKKKTDTHVPPGVGLESSVSGTLNSKPTKGGHESDVEAAQTVLHKTHKYFLPHARLNRGQRRYCHCIMKARVSKGDGLHYGFCQGLAKNDWSKAKTMKNKTKARQYYFTINKTNCIMNYDYNDYSLLEVQSFAAEKGLPLFELDASGNKKYYPKDRLVQLLVTNYVKKHTTITQPEKKKKLLKKTKKRKLKQ